MRNYKEVELWQDVDEKDWYDWKWQMRNKIRDVETLSKVLKVTEERKQEISDVLKTLRMEISPYFSLLMDVDDENCPIRKQMIPSAYELVDFDYELQDSVMEDEYMPRVESMEFGVIHRYPDRIAFLANETCGSLCRHCTRRRLLLAKVSKRSRTRREIDEFLEYVKENKQVRDVLITGGDALSYSSERIDYILSSLYEIPHVDLVRIGTRMPITLPMRVDEGLVKVLRKYKPLFVMVQVNHPKEVTDEVREACKIIVDAGAVMRNQSVLLKGVNDSVQIQMKISHELLKMRVLPYYLYQCDLSQGMSHFRTTISKGLEIIDGLVGHTSGLAVPTYIVEAPRGGGKVPLHPNTFIKIPGTNVVYVRNFENRFFKFIEPPYPGIP